MRDTKRDQTGNHKESKTNEGISLKGKERRIEGDMSVIRRSVVHIYSQFRIVFLRQDGIPKAFVTSLE